MIIVVCPTCGESREVKHVQGSLRVRCRSCAMQQRSVQEQAPERGRLVRRTQTLVQNLLRLNEFQSGTALHRELADLERLVTQMANDTMVTWLEARAARPTRQIEERGGEQCEILG